MEKVKSPRVERRLSPSHHLANVIVVAVVALTGCRDVIAPVPANPPVDVVASLTGPTTVQLSWTPRPANEFVSSYVVYRNGERAGESTTASYTDSNLLESFTLSYRVAAKTSIGEESAQSVPVSVTTKDGTPPRVVETVIADGATLSFPRNSVVLLVFSEAMDSASINASTLTAKVTSTGESIPGTVSYFKAQQYAEFRPARQLPEQASITLTTSAGMRDLAGNGLAAPYNIVLTTFDSVPPWVVKTDPANGATGVPLVTTVRITFSEPMKESTLSGVSLSGVQTTRSYDSSSNVLTLVPTSPLQSNRLYFISVGFGIMDLNGNRMNPVSFTFTTGGPSPSP